MAFKIMFPPKECNWSGSDPTRVRLGQDYGLWLEKMYLVAPAGRCRYDTEMKTLLTTLVIFGMSGFANAMKPAPPRRIIQQVNGFLIESTPRRLAKDGKATTRIYKKSTFKKEFLWEYADYIGAKSTYMSHDGLTLILFGNVYFGRQVQESDSNALVVVAGKDNEDQEFFYKDITGRVLRSDVEKANLLVKGGGWINIEKLLLVDGIDWKERQLSFTDLAGQGRKRKLNF